MKYTFAEWEDGTIITFSNIKICDTREYIRMYFEKPVPSGFYFLEARLPALDVIDQDGFSPEELNHLLAFAKDNAARIWEFARAQAPFREKAPAHLTQQSNASRLPTTDHFTLDKSNKSLYPTVNIKPLKRRSKQQGKR